VRGKNENCK